MEERKPSQAGSSAPERPGARSVPGPAARPAAFSRASAPARAVIGVGPGGRSAARLSAIEPRRIIPAGSAGAVGRRPVGPGIAPAAPRPGATGPARPGVPSGPRPMHPPISRVVRAGGLSAPAIQALAAGHASTELSGGPGAARAAGAGAVAGSRPGSVARGGFGMPNLRRNVCPHFYMTGARGAIPIQAPHLLKALVRQESNVSRCQLRGGVHMEQGYVNDVCLSARFNQCVFYEDDLGR